MEDVAKTLRNRVTRMKIGEAILQQLDKVSLPEIKISTLVKNAHISRMTFYHYYETTELALKDYISEIIHNFENQLKDKFSAGATFTKEHLEFIFDFFAQYDKVILKIEKAGCFNLINECINNVLGSDYKNHFIAGAIIQVYMKWIHSDKAESPREMAEICYPMLAI